MALDKVDTGLQANVVIMGQRYNRKRDVRMNLKKEFIRTRCRDWCRRFSDKRGRPPSSGPGMPLLFVCKMLSVDIVRRIEEIFRDKMSLRWQKVVRERISSSTSAAAIDWFVHRTLCTVGLRRLRLFHIRSISSSQTLQSYVRHGVGIHY